MTASILFLPGAGADPAFWRPVGDLLPPTWSKTYLAWPGLGHNPPSSDVQSFSDLVLFVERHLPAGPVHLVAQSLGGAVALAVALRNPSCVEHLVLATSAAGLDVTHLGAADWRPAYRAEYPEAASWVYEAASHIDGQLHTVNHPTLLLWGDADPISPVAVGRFLQRQLPYAELSVIAGGTHALANERAAEVAHLIARHLGA